MKGDAVLQRGTPEKRLPEEAIEVGVDALDPPMRHQYLSLAVLLKDMGADPMILRTLWNASEEKTIETASHLVRLSLAQRDRNDGIRLHDPQLDYVKLGFRTGMR